MSGPRRTGPDVDPPSATGGGDARTWGSGSSDLAVERRIRCGARSKEEEVQPELAISRVTHPWCASAEERDGMTGARRPAGRSMLPIPVLVPDQRMPSRPPELSGSRPLRSHSATSSRRVAGTALYWPPPDGTTPHRTARRWARGPASARPKGELLGTRYARRGEGQDPRLPAGDSESAKSPVFRRSPHSGTGEDAEFRRQVPKIPH